MGAASQIKFAIAIPQIFSQPPLPIANLQTFLTKADALGYHSAWVQEQILGRTASLEPVSLLTYAAALTRTLRLGSAVLLTPLRNPVQLAKSLSTAEFRGQVRELRAYLAEAKRDPLSVSHRQAGVCCRRS